MRKKENDDINDENRKEYNDKLIDINSPLFELISKTKNFEKYKIYIVLENIIKSKDEYKLILNKINKTKSIILKIDGDYSINKNYKYYNNNLFDSIKNNLSYLKIKFKNNKISKIDILENVNFKELKELDLIILEYLT